MLNDDNKNQENKKLKIPIPLSCLADRWRKEEEKENPVRSSSSGSSCTSDLKKRLQDLPSPNKTAQLASRAINISRRLSRKRDLYFYSATNRIEENDEKEDQQLVLPEGSFNESKYSNARIRRRAKIRLGTIQQAYIETASSPNGSDNCDLKTHVDNKTMNTTDEQTSSTIETPRSDSQRSFSSSQTPDTHSPHCKQQHFSNGTSKSERISPSLKIFSNLSSENSPKNAVKLQPVYPISLCNIPPSKFVGYRPKIGVILQNLSSSSEPGSDHENTLNKSNFASKVDYLDTVSTHGSGINSNNDDYRNVIKPPASNLSLSKLSSPSVKSDNQEQSRISSSRTTPHENYFYRLKNTPRSDYGGIRNAVDSNIDQRTFLSARENIYGCHKHYLELQPVFVKSIHHNITPSTLNEKASVDTTRYCGEKHHYNEKSPQNYQKISTPKEIFDETSRSNRSINIDQAMFLKDLSCAKESYQSLETICWEPMFENSCNSSQYPKTDDSQPFNAAISKCFLDQKEEEHVRIPISTNRLHGNTEKAYSPQFEYCTNEGHSAGSSLKESFTNEIEKKDTFSRLSAENNENLSVKIKNQNYQGEYVNVPILSLNSQEMSSSVSPLSKATSEKYLNADDLIEVLSSMSLLHTGDTYRVSRSSCSENVETENTSKSSLNIHEDSEKSASSRTHNTIPEKSLDQAKQTNLGILPTESNRQIFPKGFVISDFESLEIKNTLPQSCEESSTGRNFATSIDERAVSLKVENSKEQSEYNNSLVIANTLPTRNGSESPGYLSSFKKETQTENTSSALQTQKNSDEAFGSPNLSVNQKKHKKNCDTDSSFTESESINNYVTTTNCYETGDSASREADDSGNFLTKIKPVDSTIFPINCQINFLQSTYKEQINETFTERTKHDLLENQIGDGRFVENCNRTCFKSPSSSPDEKLGGTDTIRVSLEKMAAEQFRKNIYSEQAKTIQSETSTFFTEKLYESPLFSVAQSASTSKLRYPYDSSRFRKKSQDRFPFTMSEKPSVASYKFPGQFENLNEKSNSLKRTYKLDLHPSITRLASEGFDDTPLEIIDYVSYVEERPTRSGMRGFMQRFSTRLKKSRKRSDGTDSDTKMANILYENQDYKKDSAADSCSESSSLKEFKIYRKSSEKSNANKESPRESQSKTSEKRSRSIKNESSKDTLRSVNSCRRYDRDNVWVQVNNNLGSGCNNEIHIAETPTKMDEKLKEDSYSIFYVKSSQVTPEVSARAFLSEKEPENNVSAEKKHMVKFRTSSSTVISEVIDENILEGLNEKRNFENRRKRKNREKGCLCLRFYRMIIPVSKHRSRISHSTSSLSVKRKSRLSPR